MPTANSARPLAPGPITSQRASVVAAFEAAFGSGPTWAAYAPGRVNLIGDHTDYTGGLVLPATIDRGTHAVLRPRADGRLRVVAAGFGQAAAAVDAPVAPDRPLWERYVYGAAFEVAARSGHAAPGADLVLMGDVPVGAGLSSSASLAVAVILGLAAVWEVELSEQDAALVAQHVEHAYAGVQCGIMDQVAVRSGRAGHAVLLDCRSLDHHPVPLPGTHALVIVDSGVERSLAASAYNERRASVEEAARRLAALGVQGADGEPARSLRDVAPEALERHADALPPILARRARHVVTENARVAAAAAALQQHDLPRVGALMVASHASLRDDYEVSGPELDALVDEALEAGATGARLTGAGFGGCTVNLVPGAQLDAFVERVADRYRRRTGRTARTIVVRENRAASAEPLSD